MVWAATVPPEVQALKDMLLLVTAWTGWTTGLHYPVNSLSGEKVAADTLPNGVIAPDESSRTPYAAGARGLAGGRLSLILYADADASDLESQARLIVDGLCALYVGLPNLRGTVGMASGPTPGMRAVKAGTPATQVRYRTINLSF